MNIKILGTGCYQCIKLEELVDELVNELDLPKAGIERITDERAIRKYMPLDEIPGLVIDEQLVSTRKPPYRETLLDWLKDLERPVA